MLLNRYYYLEAEPYRKFKTLKDCREYRRLSFSKSRIVRINEYSAWSTKQYYRY